MVRACPRHAHWLDGEPITRVMPMGGVLSRLRSSAGTAPPAVGLLSLGDAWACEPVDRARHVARLAHAALLRRIARADGERPVEGRGVRRRDRARAAAVVPRTVLADKRGSRRERCAPASRRCSPPTSGPPSARAAGRRWPGTATSSAPRWRSRAASRSRVTSSPAPDSPSACSTAAGAARPLGPRPRGVAHAPALTRRQLIETLLPLYASERGRDTCHVRRRSSRASPRSRPCS